MTDSVFAKYISKNYPHKYRATLLVDTLVGGTPMSEKAIEGWIKTKLAARDEQLRAMVAEVMIDAEIPAEEAAAKVAEKMGLCGFKTDETGLYIEGRQVKSMLREASMIALAADRLKNKWGTTNKGVKGWIAEHVFVVEDRIHIEHDGETITEPSGVQQRFVHKSGPKGPVSAFVTEQYVTAAEITFTVETDHKFTDDEWAAIWLSAERNGVGASRSQGFGTFVVKEWAHL